MTDLEKFKYTKEYFEGMAEYFKDQTREWQTTAKDKNGDPVAINPDDFVKPCLGSVINATDWQEFKKRYK